MAVVNGECGLWYTGLAKYHYCPRIDVLTVPSSSTQLGRSNMPRVRMLVTFSTLNSPADLGCRYNSYRSEKTFQKM